MGHRFGLYFWAPTQIVINPAWSTLLGQSLKKAHRIPVQLFTYTSSNPPPLQEKPVRRLSCCLRCGCLVVPLCSPLPRCSLVQSLPHEKLTWNNLHMGPILVADWPGESTLPQGSPTNGGSAAWLIGRGQVAPLHFSFFCFKQQPLHCLFFPSLFCRCEKEVWGWPVVHTFKYLCTPLNALWIIGRFRFSCLFFSWFSLVT